jgi:hypothetical protein
MGNPIGNTHSYLSSELINDSTLGLRLSNLKFDWRVYDFWAITIGQTVFVGEENFRSGLLFGKFGRTV